MGGDIPEGMADLGQITQVVVLLHQITVTALFALDDGTNAQCA